MKEKKPVVIDPEEAISYRVPMKVTLIVMHSNGDTYSHCPRCDKILDREYIQHCTCCGQKLSWTGFSRLRIVPWSERHPDR